MGERGFTDEISSDSGKTYKMPDGAFDISGTLTKTEVLNKTKSAASKTDKKYAVFVTQSAGRS